MYSVLRRQFYILFIKTSPFSSRGFIIKGVGSALKNSLETLKDLNLNKNSPKLPSNINTHVKLP